MDKKKIIDDLISNQGTQWAETDREYLNSLDENVLAKMTPVETPTAPVVQNTQPPSPQTPTPKTPTVEEALAALPADIRNTLQRGMDRDKADKARLISVIKANPRNKLSDQYLNSKDVPELEALAALAAPVQNDSQDGRFVNDFSALGEPVQNNEPPADQMLTVPVWNFKKTA